MRKIRNPFTHAVDFNCFGCSSNNPIGLNMVFYEHNEEIISYWYPESNFQGYKNILHGGMHSVLADEVACWVVFIKLKTAGVTSKMEIYYKNPIYLDKGQITLKGALKEVNDNIAIIHVKTFDHDGNLCSEADVSYFIFPESIARTKFAYPGIEAFFEV